MKFIFDLDGAVTVKETLPLIVSYFEVGEEMDNLIKDGAQDYIPFIESFIRRVHVLGKLRVSDVANLLRQVTLRPKIYKFIQTHKKDCAIVTDNLDCWVDKLTGRIDCQWYTSKAKVENGKVTAIIEVLNKEQVVKKYQNSGEKVIFIGCSHNDMEALRAADIAIGSGLSRYPSSSIISFIDYLIFDEAAICRQLNQLY